MGNELCTKTGGRWKELVGNGMGGGLPREQGEKRKWGMAREMGYVREQAGRWKELMGNGMGKGERLRKRKSEGEIRMRLWSSAGKEGGI